MYYFDLASLTITAQYRPDRRANFSFGMPLLWPDGGANPLRYLGRADLRFVRVERRNGRRALRFEAGGPAFGNRGRPIWFDAADGHTIEASWGLPNHTEHRDLPAPDSGQRRRHGGVAAIAERAFRELSGAMKRLSNAVVRR